MNKVDKFFLQYVLYALPFVISLIIWGTLGDPNKLSLSTGNIRVLWDSLGWIFMIWILLSFYLSMRNIFSKSFRDKFLKKLARVKERDEREVQISGNAAKFSFFSTTGILFLFLFMSIFTMSIGKRPSSDLKEEKRGYINIGMNFNPIEIKKPQGKGIIINYQDFPMTKTGLILFLIFWQMGSYHYLASRELKS